VFDLRYHVVSLTAVLIALVIGIVVGVGLSGRGVLEDTERDRLQADIDRLNRQADLQQARIEELSAAAQYEEATYEAVIDRRLDNARVALVFVGPVDTTVRGGVQDAVEGADGSIARTRALKVPMDALEIRNALAAVQDAPAQLDDVGRALALELMNGGETPLWDALDRLIVLEQPRGPTGAVDAVVVARNAEPQTGGTAELLGGFYNGLASAGRPAVAVETGGNDDVLRFLRRYFRSSVDNIEAPTGRISLAVLLSGAETGHYGLNGDNGYVPQVEPMPSQ
jgi:Copper transport outer membrane protein, MctB